MVLLWPLLQVQRQREEGMIIKPQRHRESLLVVAMTVGLCCWYFAFEIPNFQTFVTQTVHVSIKQSAGRLNRDFLNLNPQTIIVLVRFVMAVSLSSFIEQARRG